MVNPIGSLDSKFEKNDFDRLVSSLAIEYDESFKLGNRGYFDAAGRAALFISGLGVGVVSLLDSSAGAVLKNTGSFAFCGKLYASGLAGLVVESSKRLYG